MAQDLIAEHGAHALVVEGPTALVKVTSLSQLRADKSNANRGRTR
jgi:hypothetical protein